MPPLMRTQDMVLYRILVWDVLLTARLEATTLQPVMLRRPRIERAEEVLGYALRSNMIHAGPVPHQGRKWDKKAGVDAAN